VVKALKRKSAARRFNATTDVKAAALQTGAQLADNEFRLTPGQFFSDPQTL